ncbi:Alr3199 protein [Legionella wadsworthii]|uniref:Alr3199 protein n=1 Tax=Legionella wadsworthii TaxID=28088 RepID=A0A378LW83_9GAMM|nr:hemerythrin domain-containing protein [Legionella wadsworthii]STY30237.1 Alr3199 protein [Legionella wadsworthii]
MDIYKYLKLDHEHVNHLFKQFEDSEVLERKQQIVSLICQELLVHAHSEQETFYKALKNYDTTQDEANHGYKEHKEIEDQIGLILHSKEFGSSWIKKVEKLKEIVQHHVHEEEGTMFSKAQKVLSDEEAYVLKEQMHYLKQHLLLSLQKEKPAKKAATKPQKAKIKKASQKHMVKKDDSRSRLHH